MITADQYFHNPATGQRKDHRPEHADAARDLLSKVNALLSRVSDVEWGWPIDPDTGSCISGTSVKKGGQGGGGFRLSTEPGAERSKHKLAHAVDVYDPDDKLDGWITDELLEEFGLYREHPDHTLGWCHLQDLPPKSKRRTFYP